MITQNIRYNEIQKFQELLFYFFQVFRAIPFKKRLGIVPFVLANFAYHSNNEIIEDHPENIRKLGNYISEIKINDKDKMIINSRNVYNKNQDRMYQQLGITRNGVLVNTLPENFLITDSSHFENPLHYSQQKDVIDLSYDFVYSWEMITPKYKNIKNYTKQEIYPFDIKEKSMNMLHIDIDYKSSFINRPQKSIKPEESLFLNVIIKKQNSIELFEINFSTFTDDLLQPVSDDLDIFNYMYNFKTLLNYILLYSEYHKDHFKNIKLNDRKEITPDTKNVVLQDSKLYIDVSIPQKLHFEDEQKTLFDLSNGTNIMFFSNYLYYNYELYKDITLTDKQLQEIDGGIIK